MAEIPALFGQRPIVERHQKLALYHPFIEGLALTLVDLPITFVVELYVIPLHQCMATC
jgi:ATP-binding cassette subfamily G (WHITE) protein 2 (SNQ2)